MPMKKYRVRKLLGADKKTFDNRNTKVPIKKYRVRKLLGADKKTFDSRNTTVPIRIIYSPLILSAEITYSR